MSHRLRALGERATALTTSLAVLAAGTALAATVAVVADVAAAPSAAALQNGVALTPPMGYNNYYVTTCKGTLSEAHIKQVTDLMVSQGLKAAGYNYVNLDDCWSKAQRDSAGNLVPDPVRFPSGMKALGDYIHSKGMKFGIYLSAGTATCGGLPGSLNHEQQDANLLAAWGVDYLKYDNCFNQGIDARQRYKTMGDALKATGRPIVYSICEWGHNKPATWAPAIGNLWRTTTDIGDYWTKVINRAHINQKLAAYAGPGAWNDPDMLQVGRGRQTDTEYRTQFSLWSMMAAPLIISTNLDNASAETLAILKNTDVIAVDQDPLGRQGTVISSSGGLVVMSKPLSDGSRAVSLTNETATTQTISTTAAAAGIGGAPSYTVKDLWSKTTVTSTGAISSSVPSHGTVMYRVTRNG
ncbi:glycoside hydrolase family 27 protein [Streptomyces sp. NBC_00424]|uniref:glycoside hydrolase family 27 protein n=1 Tax=Streptomyces sp. NBC_00424 TaxID=2903648 RepID=UPI002255E829|nr:glycoside hydrolase family 27 protein [Streptomyces sp. NBC_00424]MCX5077634.1 glycoside hydrolase family 27 protein [Streptomyces sp. NBC_00424]MCX5078559.1 glycoside hydrolase family 27 protein [Streptomyces sp. NBC_00424]MCX5078905.1 glycoside hydrolase family 27 protein [Streptomyces sp. NBC_00424]